MGDPTSETLVMNLRKALGLLDARADAALKASVLQLCDAAADPTFRIVFFGPFNYGKSTLLNALLGEKALPIGLVPTTGAVITVKYGPDMHSRIVLANGEEISAPGTQMLMQYATLDDQRHMRDDVTIVEVCCPHPFLKSGVTLIDLPGTDDQEAQDALVKDQLLQADLVVQLLDGRKLMTLGEREHLRDWLLSRSITTVLFVVNFLNLMEPDEQQQVNQRLRHVAESFRTDLPDGVSNLYRVDALPALRSRLKGDLPKAQTTGLPALESALQSIVQQSKNILTERRTSRLAQVVPQVQVALKQQLHRLEIQTVAQQQNKDAQKIAIQQKAQKLIKKGFDEALEDLAQWLALPNLLTLYQNELAIALQQFELKNWVDLALRPIWQQKQKSVVSWVYKAGEFFGHPRPADLWIAFPEEPAVAVTESSSSESQGSNRDVDVAPVAVATGLGWLLGGPLGAAVLGGTGYMLSRSGKPSDTNKSPVQNQDYFDQLDKVYAAAAEVYLTRLSQDGLRALAAYEIAANRVMTVASTTSSGLDSQTQAHIELIQATVNELSYSLSSFNHKSPL